MVYHRYKYKIQPNASAPGTAAPPCGFNALAISNIDNDPEPDTWIINDQREISRHPFAD